MKNIKLMGMIEDISLGLADNKPRVNKHEVTEAVRNYARVGKQLYTSGGILEAAKQLAQMAESAQNHILSETDDWFDSVSVKRNMKELKGLTAQFKKTAVEANSTNQRLSALYEDMGNILNRYYDIDEAMDPVGKEDDDIDNDGDSDDSDEYLKKRRDAISKAIKNEDVDTKSIDDKIARNVEKISKLKEKRPVPTNDVSRLVGMNNALRDKKRKMQHR